jgi:hypothetical protein
MKLKEVTMALGLFLSALAACGEGEDRFYGGSYDGWDRAVIPHVLDLTGGPQVSFSSVSNQVFDWTAADTTLAPVMIGAWVPQGTITNGGTLRVSVPTAWQCSFDIGSEVTLGGGAVGKVGVASYSGDGRTLLIPVTADFADGDTLMVSGLKLANLRLAYVGTQWLELDFTGDGVRDAYDEYALQVNVLWCGGSYDGWDTATSEPSSFWIPRGTMIQVY